MPNLGKADVCVAVNYRVCVSSCPYIASPLKYVTCEDGTIMTPGFRSSWATIKVATVSRTASLRLHSSPGPCHCCCPAFCFVSSQRSLVTRGWWILHPGPQPGDSDSAPRQTTMTTRQTAGASVGSGPRTAADAVSAETPGTWRGRDQERAEVTTAEGSQQGATAQASSSRSGST